MQLTINYILLRNIDAFELIYSEKNSDQDC